MSLALRQISPPCLTPTGRALWIRNMAALGRRAFSSGKSVSAYWCALGALCRSEVSPGLFCLRGGSPASLRAGGASGCALKHPNILSAHDIGANNGTRYLVTELLQGTTLREKLRAGPSPARRATEYAARWTLRR